MDHEHFDAISRSAASGQGPRRAALRLLAGGALGMLAARLGVAEGEAARHRRKNRKTNKASRDLPRAEGKGKKGGKGRKKPKPRPACGDGKKPCPDGSCVNQALCCPGQWLCAGGVCQNSCCPDMRACFGDDTCVAAGECCPSEKPCGDECVPNDSCCPDQKPCGSECIGEDECCQFELPLCDDSEAAACENGEWVCRSNPQECPTGQQVNPDTGQCTTVCGGFCPDATYTCEGYGVCCTRALPDDDLYCTCAQGYTLCAGQCCPHGCCGGSYCCAGG